MTRQRLLKESLSFVALLAFGFAFYSALQLWRSHQGQNAFQATGLPAISLSDALKLAAESGKPVLAELSANWCGACARFDRRVLSDPAIQDLLKTQFIYSRVDEKSPEAQRFFNEFQAQGYPTLTLLSPQGQWLGNFGLTFDPVEFKRQLMQVIDSRPSS
jgi:thiol:disulfide interchange protein